MMVQFLPSLNHTFFLTLSDVDPQSLINTYTIIHAQNLLLEISSRDGQVFLLLSVSFIVAIGL